MESTNPILPEGLAGTEINWKSELTDEYHQVTANKISEYMMRGFRAGPEEAPRFKMMAADLVEKILLIATSEKDYCDKLKAKTQELILRYRQSSSMPSPPDLSYSLESSVHQATPVHRYHHQGTSPKNQPKLTSQQQQKANAINSQSSRQQKAVPDLLTQQRLLGMNSNSGRNMHQKVQLVNTSAFNGQPINIGLQNNPGNKFRVPKPMVQPQAQQARPQAPQARPQAPQAQPQAPQALPQDPPALPQAPQAHTEQPNLQVMSQVHENNMQVMAEGASQAIYSEGDDWKEKIHNKLKNLKSLFLPTLAAKAEETKKMLQKIESIPEQQRTTEYKTVKEEYFKYSKCCEIVNIPRDRISKQLGIRLPGIEKFLYKLVQYRTGAPVSSSQEKQLPAGEDAESLRQPIQLQTQKEQKRVTVEREDGQLQKCRRTGSLGQHKEQRGLQHHHESVNSAAQKSIMINQASNGKQILGKRFETGNLGEDESLSLCANTGDVMPEATCSLQVVKTLPSSLLAENAAISGKESYNSGTGLTGSSAPEEPIQRLIRAARSISCDAFDACVGDMESVLGMIDMRAGQVSGNGSRFKFGEDLAAPSVRCNGLNQDFTSQKTQRYLYATSIPFSFSESGTIANHNKKSRCKVNCDLLEEIGKINWQLIETVVEIVQHGSRESGEGTVVRCSYTPVAISSRMKPEPAMFPASFILPLKLLVPVNYPALSPEILDEFPWETSKGCEDLSTKAKSKLMLSLSNLDQPISLTDTVRTWDTCVRAVISDFAQKQGGGSFSTTYGTWKVYSGVD